MMQLPFQTSVTNHCLVDSTLDIDAFSEEFDLRMKCGRVTMPRPASHGAPPPSHPPPPRPGHPHGHHTTDHVHHHRHSEMIMNTSQLSDKSGDTLQHFISLNKI